MSDLMFDVAQHKWSRSYESAGQVYVCGHCEEQVDYREAMMSPLLSRWPIEIVLAMIVAAREDSTLLESDVDLENSLFDLEPCA